MNKSLSIHDLRKISAKEIESLEGATPIKSGERTIATITPLRRPNLRRLKKALLLAEKLAKNRDVAADDVALEAFGPVDKTDWSFAARRSARGRSKRTE